MTTEDSNLDSAVGLAVGATLFALSEASVRMNSHLQANAKPLNEPRFSPQRPFLGAKSSKWDESTERFNRVHEEIMAQARKLDRSISV